MAAILYILSILWLALGVCIILYTADTRAVFKTVMGKTDTRILAVLPLLVGLLLIAAASASYQPWFLRLLGICALLKAVLFFANPQNLATRLTTWFLETLSENTYRLWGIIVVILATALFSWVR